MVRPLRVAVEDGWYHVMSRGLERRAIFSNDRDRKHFLELIEGACERYRLLIHAYAGYESCPTWLSREELLSRAQGARGEIQARYRADVKDKLTHGMSEPFLERRKEGLALGSAEFVENLRSLVSGKETRELVNKRVLRARVSYRDVVQAVETIRGEPAEDFLAEHGGWGMGLVLWGARQYAGMTLNELGEVIGKDYGAIAMRLTTERSATRERLPGSVLIEPAQAAAHQYRYGTSCLLSPGSTFSGSRSTCCLKPGCRRSNASQRNPRPFQYIFDARRRRFLASA